MDITIKRLPMKRVVHGWAWALCVSFALGAASAAEGPHPFEDPKTHLWGYRNSSGKVLIKPRFLAVESFSPLGLAPVADDTGWKYINRRGEVVIRPFMVDNGPDPFREGLARYRRSGKFGFFDERGNVVIPACLDFAEPFSSGLAAFCLGCREHEEDEHHVYRGGKWGFIDTKGVIVIPARFDETRPFEGDQAQVMLNGQWVAINRNGMPMVDPVPGETERARRQDGR